MNAIAQLRTNSPRPPDPAVLLAAVQACPESLAIVASGCIVYANPAWRAMFECLERLHPQGGEAGDLLPEPQLSVTRGARPGEEREINGEARVIRTRKDGTRVHLEVARADFELRGCEFQVVHSRDVSWQWQAERRQRESQGIEAVGQLVGGVAHDFNNLLTGIILYCDLLLGELEEDSQTCRHVREMRMAGEHGVAMVQQLLAVARPPANESHVFVLNDAVRGIQDLIVRLIGEDIVLNTALAADLGKVKMDPAQVQQILLNLVLNARDAMPGGGGITVSTRNGTGPSPIGGASGSQSGQWVELTVTDTGEGMDAATVERALRAFLHHQESGAGQRPGPGHRPPAGPARGGNHYGGKRTRNGHTRLHAPAASPTRTKFESSRKVIS